MLVRVKSVINFLSRSIHKYSLSMNKAYFRNLNGCDQFQLTFQYTNVELKINRQFNFSRQLSEPVSAFLSRISANVEKIVNKKNKKKLEQNIMNVNVSLIVDNEEVCDSKECKEVFNRNNNLVLTVLDKSYTVVVNSPWVDNLTLPTVILSTFPIHPSKFEVVFTNKHESQFTWYISENKLHWVQICDTYLFTPSNSDVNMYLKFECLPRNGELEGPLVEVISENTIQAGPGQCPFEIRHNFTKDRVEGKEFRVVSYNILADLYCDSDFTRNELHPYCPPYALAIDYRKQLILKELLGYNADVICLQEVDKKVFVHDLNPILSEMGFESDFAIKGGNVAEGVACFYRSERFKLIEKSRTVLSDHISTDPLYADIWEKIAVNQKLTTRILERTTTVQINTIQSIDDENELLLVANTHLYFHPDADHIRLLHGGLIIRYIESIVDKLKRNHTASRISVIFCGDFNSVPECGIYKLYTTGFVSEDCADFCSNAEEAIRHVNLEQSLKLDSACGTPKYTNFTAGFADCLDYIYYEKSNLAVSQIIPLPSIEELTQYTALPSIVSPSDHIALICDLKWV